MKFLKDLFNRQTSLYVSMDALAAMAEPVLGPGHIKRDPASVAHAWNELTDWVRIGFDAESHKGTHYNALHMAMRRIAGAIQESGRNGESPAGLYIRRDDLRVLRATYWQFEEAAQGLRMIAKYQKKKPATIITVDEDGRTWATPDFTNVIAIYNRPNENHVAAALRVAECQRRFDSFFVRQTLRPANDSRITSYADMTRHLR